MVAAGTEDFGFQHIMWVYSGRRGVHCWVCDDHARALSNDGRNAVVEYLSISRVSLVHFTSHRIIHRIVERGLGFLFFFFLLGVDCLPACLTDRLLHPIILNRATRITRPRTRASPGPCTPPSRAYPALPCPASLAAASLASPFSFHTYHHHHHHHQIIRRAYDTLEPMFEALVLGEEGQGVLDSQDSWDEILDSLPDDGK